MLLKFRQRADFTGRYLSIKTSKHAFSALFKLFNKPTACTFDYELS